MNWEQLQGQMKQVGGKIKEKWAKITDDDLLLIQGKKDVFIGKLQERSGLAKDEAEKQFDAFIAKIDVESHAAVAVAAATVSPKVEAVKAVAK